MEESFTVMDYYFEQSLPMLHSSHDTTGSMHDVPAVLKLVGYIVKLLMLKPVQGPGSLGMVAR